MNNEWQPMENAPKDGTKILMCGGFTNYNLNTKETTYFISIGFWGGKRPERWICYPNETYPERPVGWMHLPKPLEYKK